jgi:hypothetical protein
LDLFGKEAKSDMAITNIAKRNLLYQDESCRVYWDSDVQCIEFDAIRFVSSSALRATLERTLGCIKDKRARKFLIGIDKMDNAPMEDLMWAETDWFPRCLRAGIRYVAMVMPKSLSAFVSVDKATSRIKPDASGFVRWFIPDIEAGRQWLKEQK